MITQQRLKELVSYDKSTGVFTSLKYRNKCTYKGKILGHSTSFGHKMIYLDKVSYLAHRLVWLYVYGHWPPEIIDHINGDPADNRLVNLREASYSQNTFAGRKFKKASSKHRGVSWQPSRKKWIAYICVSGKDINLGRFTYEEDALEARKSAAVKYYGEFAQT